MRKVTDSGDHPFPPHYPSPSPVPHLLVIAPFQPQSRLPPSLQPPLSFPFHPPPSPFSLVCLPLFFPLPLSSSLPLPQRRQGVLSTPPPAVHTLEKRHNPVLRPEEGLSTTCRSASPRLSLQLKQDPGHTALLGRRECLLPSWISGVCRVETLRFLTAPKV